MAPLESLQGLRRFTLLYAETSGLKGLSLNIAFFLIGLCVLVLGPLLPLPQLLLIIGLGGVSYLYASQPITRWIDDLYTRRWGVVQPRSAPFSPVVGIGCGLALLPWLCFAPDSMLKLPISLTYLAFAFVPLVSMPLRKMIFKEWVRPPWYVGMHVLLFACLALAPLAGVRVLVPPSANFWFVLAASGIVQDIVEHFYLVASFSHIKRTSYDTPA